MSMKWTPGPWTCHPITKLFGGQSIQEDYAINAVGKQVSDWYGLAEVVTETEDGYRDEEGVANAHLIAAAPELYDAAFQALQVIATIGGPAYSEVERATATRALVSALAKARGEK